MTDPFIKTTFIKPVLGLRPKIFTAKKTDAPSFTLNVTLQPPAGEEWSLLFASVMFTDADSATDNLDTFIILSDNGTEIQIDSRRGTNTSTNNQQSRLSLGSSANGPIQMTNTQYIILRATKNGTSTTATAHITGIISVN